MAALVVLVLGAGLYVLSGISGGLPASVLSGLASAFVALGIVTIISETLLKNAFTADLLELVGIERELYNAGVLSITEEPDFDWRQFTGEAGKVEAIVLNPVRWRTSVWPHLLRVARRPGGRNITVSFIDPTAEGVVQHAARLTRETPTTYGAQVTSVADALEQDWKSGQIGSRAVDMSELTINFLPYVPPYSVVRADSATCIVLTPVFPDAGGQEGRCIVFREMAGTTSPHEWCAEGIGLLVRAAPAPQYTNDRDSDEKEDPS